MNGSVAFSLVQEGLTNGAVYSLIALSLVLVFAVTRVILVQAGEFVSYGALTVYTLQNGRTPMTLWFMLAACLAAGGLELWRLRRAQARGAAFWRPALAWWLAPMLVAVAVHLAPKAGLPMALQAAFTLAIVVPLGAALYRLVYRPVAQASILVLLIVSVACHFVLDGLALVAFGPEGARTASFTDASFDLAGQSVSGQALAVLAASLALVGALFAFSKHTMAGRALRAAASSRRGAALMGISADMAGLASFGLMALICATAGMLIAPFTTIYYNSGLLISLKAFIGATVGAMASYPLAAGGAMSIGLFESFAAFWSSAYKDSLVFALMVPILLVCSLLAKPAPDDEQERAADLPPVPTARRARWRDALLKVPGRPVAAVALVLVLALPLVLSPYYVSLASYVCLYAIVAYGVVLLTGVAGQVSFGQAAFVGIGAYVSALLSTSCEAGAALRQLLGPALGGALTGPACGVSPWVSLPFALAATAASAWILGLVTLRMRGHYLPIATIAWSVSLFYLFANTDSIGASTGMTNLPPVPLPAGGALGYEGRAYYLVLALAVALGWASRNLLDSRLGRAIRALKNRSAMAESVGVDTGLLKTQVFVCAAVYAGAAGWLYAHLQRFISPVSFGLDMSVQYVFMAVVGGVEQVAGALLGSAAVRFMADAVQRLLQFDVLAWAGNVEKVVFGVLIIVLLQRTQHGIAFLFKGRMRTGAVPRVPRLPVGLAVPPSPGGVLLRLAGVSKRFGGLAAVADVSFEVSAGEIVAVIGPNGAGKSTIFNLVSGALPLSSGRISFAGQRIDGLSPAAIARRGLSRTFQHVKLLPDLSVLENAALGAYRHGRVGLLATLLRLDRLEEARALDSAAAALQRTGLLDAAHQRAGALPLGRQRILEIARALASQPRLLLLDEPAAGLRAAEKAELAALLRALRREGVAILLVEHDMAFVMQLADRVVVQNFGRTLAAGAPADVQAHPEVITAYLGAAA